MFRRIREGIREGRAGVETLVFVKRPRCDLTNSAAVAGFFASGASFRVEGESETSGTRSRFDLYRLDV